VKFIERTVARLELRVPPVPLAVLCAAAIWLVARLLPQLQLFLPARGAGGVVLGLSGAVIALAGVVTFRRERTTVNPLQPERATVLVASGIYRLTRNPMYLGLLAVLAGWAWFQANAAGLVLLPLFVVYLNLFQIAAEERALSARFGTAFHAYKRSTRRWL
jgi:protein-S-isoprenylcysteine O-methyltransferase Ste14